MKTTYLVLAVVAVALAGLGTAYLLAQGQYGTLVVGVKDAPSNSNVTHIYLTISSIVLQGSDNKTTATYKVNSTSFDLLSLVSVTKMLGSNSVPAGNYTMISFNVTTAVATISGTNHTLNVPSEEVKVPVHFSVKSGKTTTIVLDFMPDMTAISTSGNLRPVVTYKVTEPS